LCIISNDVPLKDILKLKRKMKYYCVGVSCFCCFYYVQRVVQGQNKVRVCACVQLEALVNVSVITVQKRTCLA